MKLYVTEYSWMWSEMHLTMAECRVYAYIYGLTYRKKKEGVQGYNGSKRHLAELLGLNAGAVKRVLDTLKDRHLIVYTDKVWHSVATNNGSVVSDNESVATNNESVATNNSPYNPLYNNINNKNKESVPRTSADTTTEINLLNKIYYQIDMESLDDALKRRESIKVIWELLNPAPEYRDFYGDVMRYWNRIPRERQLQMWYFLKRKIDNKQPIDPNPLQVIKDCHPYPIDYNGTAAYKDMIASPVKMVKACYRGHFGAYELMDARLWHMTHIVALN